MAAEIETYLKQGRTIPFSGKQSDWRIWQAKFLSNAAFRGYRDIVEGKVVVPNDSVVINAGTDEGKKQQKLRDKNQEALNDLMISCNDEVCIGAIESATTNDYKSGSARQAWKNLLEIYQPQTMTNKTALIKEFTNSALSDSSKNPDIWIDELENIRKRLKLVGIDKSDEEMVMHIMNNLPNEYDTLVSILEHELNSINTTLSLSRLRVEVRAAYQRMEMKNKNSKDEAYVNYRPFKGRCRECGKIGHKAQDCRSRNQNNNRYNNNNNNRNNNYNNNRSNDENKNQNNNNYNRTNQNNFRQNQNNNRRPFNGTCFKCGKRGHMAVNCRSGANENQNNNQGTAMTTSNSQEEDNTYDTVAFVATSDISMNCTSMTQERWLLDSGASNHMTNVRDGIYEFQECDKYVRIGDGSDMNVVGMGKLDIKVTDIYGKALTVTLQNVRYVPKLACNLLSMGRIHEKGLQAIYENNSMYIKNDRIKIELTDRIKTDGADLFALKAERVYDMANVLMDAKLLHDQLGHPNVEATITTARKHGIKLKNINYLCEHCVMGKSRQKNVHPVATSKSGRAGERLFLDLSTFSEPTLGGSKYWLLVVDEYTGMKFTFLLKQKNDLSDTVMKFLNDLHKIGFNVKSVRMDNAGENIMFAKALSESPYHTLVEYTAPNTPEQNGVVERAFATLYGKLRATYLRSDLSQELKNKLKGEAVRTLTITDNLTYRGKVGMSPYEKFYKRKPLGIEYLRRFGEIGIICNRNKLKAKDEDRGIKCIFVGYADDHTPDTYRMYNPKTKRVVLSRDIRWLNTFKLSDDIERFSIIEELEVNSDEDENNNNILNEISTPNVNPNTNVPNAPVGRQPVTRLPREVRNLHTSYNDIYQNLDSAFYVRDVLDKAEPEISTEHTDYGKVEISYQEAINGPDKEQWKKAIEEEVKKWKQREVYETIKIKDVPQNKRLVGSRWVFERRKDGQFRARVVAQGFTQIPGVDFKFSHAPVINDITFHILLLEWFVNNNWIALQIDIRTAFLYGDLEEEIYMRMPEGFDAEQDECMALLKSTYGLVQAARQWYIKLVKYLRKQGYQRSFIDPCLIMKRRGNEIVIILVYVDDCALFGTTKIVYETIKIIAAKFKIRKEEILSKYVGCEIKKKEFGILLNQPWIVQDIKNEFDLTNSEPVTPGNPNETLRKAENENEVVNENLHKLYRSGVGKLLYLTKHSRPDISNSLRELSQHLDKPTRAHIRALFRALDYVANSSENYLILKPSKHSNELTAYVDSDYATNKDNRKSVTGYLIFFRDALIAWKSKLQDAVTLSSTEAEYTALSEVNAMIKYIKQILKFLGIGYNEPTRIFVDNTGAIFLANNWVTSSRTKHIDVKYHFIRETIEDGQVEVVYIRTSENPADMFTKNLSGDKYEYHRMTVMDGMGHVGNTVHE